MHYKSAILRCVSNSGHVKTQAHIFSVASGASQHEQAVILFFLLGLQEQLSAGGVKAVLPRGQVSELALAATSSISRCVERSAGP